MDEKVHKEAEGRRKMEEELREQRGLIDALTAESMSLREVTASLQVRQTLNINLSNRIPTLHCLSFHRCVLSGRAAAADHRGGAEVGLGGLIDGGTRAPGPTC